MKNIWMSVMVMGVISLIIVGINFVYDNKNDIFNEESIAQDADYESSANGTAGQITIWYSDKTLEAYVNFVADEYLAEKNVEVKVLYVSPSMLLQKINDANKGNEVPPDVYIIESSQLERAYLAGLTTKNTFMTTDFPQTAIDAATYKGNLCAYPLCYETGVFVYNSEYVSFTPETFDDILNFANSFEGEGYELSGILKWDAKQLLYNFGFIGNYINFGGKNGDESDVIDISEEKVIESLNYYYKMKQYFSINISDVDYEEILNEFIEGKLVFSILNGKDIGKLDESGLSYKVVKMPKLTDELETKPVSITTLAVINPYCENEERAKDFVSYITVESSDSIYEKTGLMPCRATAFLSEGLMGVQEQYEESKGIPKLFASSEYWVQLEIAMNNIWNGKDIDTTIKELEDYLKQ